MAVELAAHTPKFRNLPYMQPGPSPGGVKVVFLSRRRTSLSCRTSMRSVSFAEMGLFVLSPGCGGKAWDRRCGEAGTVSPDHDPREFPKRSFPFPHRQVFNGRFLLMDSCWDMLSLSKTGPLSPFREPPSDNPYTHFPSGTLKSLQPAFLFSLMAIPSLTPHPPTLLNRNST